MRDTSSTRLRGIWLAMGLPCGRDDMFIMIRHVRWLMAEGVRVFVQNLHEKLIQLVITTQYKRSTPLLLSLELMELGAVDRRIE